MNWDLIIDKGFNFGVPTLVLAALLWGANHWIPKLIMALNLVEKSVSILNTTVEKNAERESLNLEKIKENYIIIHEEHSRILELADISEKKMLNLEHSLNGLKDLLFEKCKVCKYLIENKRESP